MSNTDRLLLVIEDTENDAAALDGKEFNGKTVGTQFGNVLAAIQCVARVLRDELLTQAAKEKP